MSFKEKGSEAKATSAATLKSQLTLHESQTVHQPLGAAAFGSENTVA